MERRLLAEPERLLRRVALIAGLAILVMLVGVAVVPFDPFLLLPPLDIATNKHAAVSLSQLLYMALNCLLVAVPFLLVGFAIGLAIRTSPRDVARVYLSDLAGAGIGAAITVPAILLLGTPGAVLLAAGLAFGAATVFASGRREGLTVPILGIMLLMATGRPLLRHLEFVPSAGKGLSVRVAIAVATLLPLGLVMGMFFPTGIRALAPRPAFVPWAWAANGCASVVGTVVAVMLAMAYGFRAVSLVALVCYAAGVGGILSAQARGPLTAAPAG